MRFDKLSPKLLAGILVVIFFSISLYIRAVLPAEQVFGGEWIKFTGIDAYYHMRMVDSIVHNFPHFNSFDPYLIYPAGAWLHQFNFFDVLLAGIIWVVGLGHPTQHTIDIVGVYFPAILGALMVIPVYFIGKALFNRWAGVLAAALIAILPGEFLGRSILGFTDQHIAESLFSTVAILFLILAVKTSRERQLTFSHLRKRDWSVIARPLLFSLLAGFTLGIYLITWAGGLLFVFVITLYLVIQFIIDHLRHQSTDYLGTVGVVLFFVALIIFLPISLRVLYTAALVIALLIPAVLSAVSRLVEWKELKSFYYPLSLLGLAAVGLGIFYAINPGLLALMLGRFSIFAPTGATAATTLEMRPLFFPADSFTTALAWGNFTTGLVLFSKWPIPGFGPIALIIIIWMMSRRNGTLINRSELILLIVWCLVLVAATLGQRRFAYYFAVNVAVLSGYFAWLFLRFTVVLTDWLFGRITTYEFRKKMPELVETPKAAEPEKIKEGKKRRKEEFYPAKYAFMSLALIAVFIFVYYFNIPGAISVASKARFAPSDAWCSSLAWMKGNTPDPFADPDFYYQRYEDIPKEEEYSYPESAYGVTAWWDYGYWITRMAHRMPSANPSQEPEPITNVAQLFLSQGESPPQELVEKLDSSYLIMDYETATNKFWAVVTWSGEEVSEFFEYYYMPYEGRLVPAQVYYPAYYNALCTRLYNFDNRDVTDVQPVVISYEERVHPDIGEYKQITGIEDFSSYQEAQDSIESKESGNHLIVGANPFISPVPLEAVKGYKLVHSSKEGVSHRDVGTIPGVKIFEYVGVE